MPLILERSVKKSQTNKDLINKDLIKKLDRLEIHRSEIDGWKEKIKGE